MSRRTKMWRGQRYKIWQLAVFKKDGYKCTICGSSENLTADHIKVRVAYSDLFYDVQNGRTLCEACRIKDMLDSWQKGKFKKKLVSQEAGLED